MFCSIYGTLGESQPFELFLLRPSFFLSGCPGWASQTLFTSTAKTCTEPPAPPVHISIMGRTLLWPCEFIFIAGISFLVGYGGTGVHSLLNFPCRPFMVVNNILWLSSFLHMEKLRTSYQGLGGQGNCPFDGKSEDLWESQCDILQCSSRDQSIPHGDSPAPLPPSGAWLYSQKCTFPPR